MISGCSFAGYYAVYSPHEQEQSPHVLRLIWLIFAAPVPSIFTGSTTFSIGCGDVFGLKQLFRIIR
jgi:hypothetical protein